MGIGVLELQFLLHEHKHKPFTGEILSIGRQATALTEKLTARFMKEYDVKPGKNAFVEFDTSRAPHPDGSLMLTDKSLFSLFCDAKFLAADISDYEQPDFVFDICGKVPWKYRNRFDFVMDGGSLDNVFDTFRMMANMTQMLKPGGRMFLTPWINSHPTAYVKLSPDWVMDYYAVNEFEDAKVYIYEGRIADNDRFAQAIWQYDPVTKPGAYTIASITSSNIQQLYAIAVKAKKTTHNKHAIQQHYRGKNREPYLTSAARFQNSDRPIFHSPNFSRGQINEISNQNAMRHIGTVGPAPSVSN